MKWRKLSAVENEYDCIVHPAAILSDVVVQNLLGTGVSPGWHTVVDSGSDLTVIPNRAAAYLQINVAAKNLERRPVRIGNSMVEDCPRVFVQICHPDFGLLKPIKAGIMDRDTILLGRDCLKQVVFQLHGPKKRFIIHQYRHPLALFLCRFLTASRRQRLRIPEKLDHKKDSIDPN